MQEQSLLELIIIILTTEVKKFFYTNLQTFFTHTLEPFFLILNCFEINFLYSRDYKKFLYFSKTFDNVIETFLVRFKFTKSNFDKCGYKGAPVATFVANFFITLDNAGLKWQDCDKMGQPYKLHNLSF